MLSLQKLFGNQFDDAKITSTRLANFAEDCLNRLKGVAIEGQYGPTITELTNAIERLRNDLSGIDTSVNSQKVKTITVNKFIGDFRGTMKTVEGMVAFRTGGRKSAVYQELYPHGVTEYSQARKTHMPILMSRVNEVANRYGSQLSQELTDILGGLKTNWETVVKEQEQQMSKVSKSRNNRTDARKAVELALHNAYHTLALMYPFNVKKCKQFFNLQLLYGSKHHNEVQEQEPAQEQQQQPSLEQEATPVS